MAEDICAQRHLPDWNDLPDTLRRSLVEVVERETAGSNVEDFAGDIALAVYNRLAEGLPAPVFPLFEHARLGSESLHG